MLSNILQQLLFYIQIKALSIDENIVELLFTSY